MTVAFIVGVNAGRIDDEARRTHGWQRMSVTRWRDGEGQTVIYLNDPAQLRGIRNATVFLAQDYELHANWEAIAEAMDMQGCETVDLNE